MNEKMQTTELVRDQRTNLDNYDGDGSPTTTFPRREFIGRSCWAASHFTTPQHSAFVSEVKRKLVDTNGIIINGERTQIDDQTVSFMVSFVMSAIPGALAYREA